MKSFQEYSASIFHNLEMERHLREQQAVVSVRILRKYIDAAKWVWRGGLADMVIYPIMWYQRFLSPDHSPLAAVAGRSRCRFYPSCSAYAIDAIRQYGLFLGGMASLKRIVRCNPLSEGGFDPLQMQNANIKNHNDPDGIGTK